MDINKWYSQKLNGLLESFYEHLSSSISQPFSLTNDTSARSFIMNTSVTFHSFQHYPKTGGGAGGGTKTFGEIHDNFGDTRRHIERLLLRLDFSSNFSKPSRTQGEDEIDKGGILRQGGLA